MAPPVVYVPETGHHMLGVFARFWHNTGGSRIVGYPITETLIEDGLRTQYFENFKLQYAPSEAGNGGIRVVPIGRQFAPASLTAIQQPQPLWPAFASFYDANHGAVLLGLSLGQPVRANRRWIQWFENGRLEARGTPEAVYAVQATAVGVEAAGDSGADTRSVSPEPGALGSNPRNFTRWFEADLSTQTLLFWEAGSVVHETRISSGRIRPTPIGQWTIYRRVENERMVGGEPGTAGYYDLDNVLYTQYFTEWFDALHYAYWHNNFGQPMSHGCINMRLGDSWLGWQFGTYGTTVETHA